MTKVIFSFSEENKWGFINLEGSRRRIELFSDCDCKVYDVRWLNNDFIITDGRGHKCNFLVNAQDLSMISLSGELVKAPIKDELIMLWTATDPLYYVPLFSGQRGWLLVLDETASHYYSLGLGDHDLKALLAELGDAPIVVERVVHGSKVYSPDGTMYARHGSTGFPLRIYSRDGNLLAEAKSTHSRAVIGVYGWMSDNKGVYFHVFVPYQPEPLFLLRLPEK